MQDEKCGFSLRVLLLIPGKILCTYIYTPHDILFETVQSSLSKVLQNLIYAILYPVCRTSIFSLTKETVGSGFLLE